MVFLFEISATCKIAYFVGGPLENQHKQYKEQLLEEGYVSRLHVKYIKLLVNTRLLTIWEDNRASENDTKITNMIIDI